YEDMIDMGARIQQVQGFAAHVSDQDCYRQGDYDRLVSRVQQLEKMLPLQTYSVCLPYQYELPGSELFNTGNVHLRPVLRSVYGLPYVSTKEEPSVFLRGRTSPPTLTDVIAGGKESHSVPDVDKEGKPVYKTEVEVISRELLKVTIKPISTELSANPIHVRVATPAGTSKFPAVRPTPPAEP